jgi:hypothetical protein
MVINNIAIPCQPGLGRLNDKQYRRQDDSRQCRGDKAARVGQIQIRIADRRRDQALKFCKKALFLQFIGILAGLKPIKID